MSHRARVTPPIELPCGWCAEAGAGWPGLVTLVAPTSDDCCGGAVTVNEKSRLFALGFSDPDHLRRRGRSLGIVGGPFQGRGWRERLYADAVQALQKATRHTRAS